MKIVRTFSLCFLASPHLFFLCPEPSHSFPTLPTSVLPSRRHPLCSCPCSGSRVLAFTFHTWLTVTQCFPRSAYPPLQPTLGRPVPIYSLSRWYVYSRPDSHTHLSFFPLHSSSPSVISLVRCHVVGPVAGLPSWCVLFSTLAVFP
ncbi:hypothetical protein EXIGLDRAFT_721703 [Exidia glandulosa HHB12029]|uniref:Secreted protein n=1 Tax=Exidia glandulosa HHB12029 TaxID=1314781 RepID=A0A165QDP9_EXIGL|nr:hypothetical protein EXIGLDRAFT_721703 [Exidia glandulosa HHB12029]